MIELEVLNQSIANPPPATGITPRPATGISSFRFAMGIVAMLIASGFLHLAMIGMLGTSWQGPLSLRKPALFGISGGLTVWSIVWLMQQLRPQRLDRLLANSFAFALFIEVALITLQYWRGVGSHFNRTTWVDAVIEFTMMGLILAVSLGIFYLTVRTFWLRAIDPSMAIALRGGMWLLALSCGLGIATSALGEISLALGKSYELWGVAGVLKFPHGVALHAIQTLPVVAWLGRRLRLQNSVRIVQSTLMSQILFLMYAVWQTSQGRDRFDWDTIGAGLLLLAILFGLYFPIAIIEGFRRIGS